MFMLAACSTTSDNIDKYGDVDLTKYNKMKQLGIQVEAIEHKMIMEGLKKDCIKYWMDFQALRLTHTPLPNKGNGHPPLPPPPPPPPIVLHQMKGPSFAGGAPKLPDFLRDIKSNNFSLKKRGENDVTPSNKVNTKLVSKIATKFKDDFGYQPPTLQDILNARSSLKKVAK